MQLLPSEAYTSRFPDMQLLPSEAYTSRFPETNGGTGELQYPR